MFCKTFSSTISCEVCIKRQRLAQQLGKKQIILKGKTSLLACFDCETGKRLSEEGKRYLDRDLINLKKEVMTKTIISQVINGEKSPRRKIIVEG